MPHISGRADAPTLPTVPCLTSRAAAVSHRTPSTEKNQSGQGRRMHLSVLSFTKLQAMHFMKGCGNGHKVQHSPGRVSLVQSPRSWSKSPGWVDQQWQLRLTLRLTSEFTAQSCVMTNMECSRYDASNVWKPFDSEFCLCPFPPPVPSP